MSTTTVTKTASPQTIYREAIAAADTAFAGATPTPMLVGTAIGLSDEIDYTKPTYVINDGLCGFAWVNIKPARGKFVTWLKSQGIGRTDTYYGGYTIWSPGGDRGSQSYERKMAAAAAFAKVLRSYGIEAHASGRLD
jgi:hypothetical protein